MASNRVSEVHYYCSSMGWQEQTDWLDTDSRCGRDTIECLMLEDGSRQTTAARVHVTTCITNEAKRQLAGDQDGTRASLCDRC